MLDSLRRLIQRHKRRRSLQERYPQYRIGVGTYGDNVTIASWGEGASLSIGNYCSLANGVKILLGGEHRIDWVTTYPFSVLWAEASSIKGHPRSKGDVVIGSDVWIGADATILSGVSIGHGAVIGAAAVVSKDVPPYAIAAGNPARTIKYRFDDATIAELLQIEWWNWSKERIVTNISSLLNVKVDEFISRHRH